MNGYPAGRIRVALLCLLVVSQVAFAAAGSKKGPKIQIRGNWVIIDEVYRAVLDLPKLAGTGLGIVQPIGQPYQRGQAQSLFAHRVGQIAVQRLIGQSNQFPGCDPFAMEEGRQGHDPPSHIVQLSGRMRPQDIAPDDVMRVRIGLQAHVVQQSRDLQEGAAFWGQPVGRKQVVKQHQGVVGYNAGVDLVHSVVVEQDLDRPGF